MGQLLSKNPLATKISPLLYQSLVEVTNVVDFPRDRKDAKFLACALATDADFLLTGDKDFEEAKNLGKTRIISVSLFKRLLIEKK